eukprot:CAMPEP_0202956324 /NCGR_PEP_ID=MMETSP1396-20130829/827_1 /ASSEMBLY_ACC=CAM_ASM_000872 /TAXON_ID= /ORGANISM="Pseudokeronopsis sp., Strain Brazil" /LENGTH=53 /DNA_ID=CAMNT_0049673279 /DNA_START=33 /DNA_END=194 /DNA_ORIENTATION=-
MDNNSATGFWAWIGIDDDSNTWSWDDPSLYVDVLEYLPEGAQDLVGEQEYWDA